ncbi:MAG: hypothetical protein XD78_0910 [Desulfotomaculum sp. 46_296]|nr:MAG: hypothetical protein XD78_0910 [Desulfotomaculum sp. 46_296]HAG09763.1 hypothetical protein [Desulfotomaculum sp.]HAU30995.1 hypothetical protein [Desulfotomaculum sp.]
MKKVLLIAIAALLLIAVSLPVAFASNNADNKQAPNASFQKNYLAQKLTDAQKADLYKISQQMLNLQKQMIQKYVDFGVITQDQANLIITKMTDNYNKMKEKGLVPGPGMGRMKGFGRGGLKCPLQQNATQ